MFIFVMHFCMWINWLNIPENFIWRFTIMISLMCVESYKQNETNKLLLMHMTHLQVSGDCVCKSNVQGASCNQCKGNTWGLALENLAGCIPCQCDPTGTQLGNQVSADNLACNQNTGQCSCLANRDGRQCDDCVSGRT